MTSEDNCVGADSRWNVVSPEQLDEVEKCNCDFGETILKQSNLALGRKKQTLIESLNYETCQEINAYGFLNRSFVDQFPCQKQAKVSNLTEKCDEINDQYHIKDNFDIRCSCPSSRSRQETVEKCF